MEAVDENPSEEQTEEQADTLPNEEYVEQLVEEPVEERVEEHVEEHLEEHLEEPIEEHVEEHLEEPIEEHVEEPIEEPTEEHVEEPIEEHVEEHVEERVEEPVDEHVKEHVEEHEEPVEEQVEEKEADVEEQVEVNEEHVEEHVKENVEEPVEEPVAEANEPSADNEEATVGSEALDDQPPGISASEEQILMEDEILYEENREMTMVEEIVMEAAELPEAMEILQVEELMISESLSVKEELDTYHPALEFGFEEEDPLEKKEVKGEQVVPKPDKDDIAIRMVEDFLGDAAGAVLFLHPKTGEETESSKKRIATSSISPKNKAEMAIRRSLQTPAPKHDYFGLIFSASSKRPPSYYHNYFLPIQKQPAARQHMRILGKVIPYEAVKPFISAPTHSMPLSTVKIRWRLHRVGTVYTSEDLYAYLTRYGPIEHVYQLTNNSALVVFSTLEAASTVVRMPGLGYPWDPLIADWLEPRMNNHGYYTKYAIIEESPDKAIEECL